LNNNYPKLQLKDIDRKHLVSYLQYIKNKKILNKKTRETIMATNVYVSSNITIVRKFLTDLKIFNWKDAPIEQIEALFLPNDNTNRIKSQNYDNHKSMKDYKWDQDVKNIHIIGDRYIPII